MNVEDQRHLKSLIRHLDNVKQSCSILGERLIEEGEDRLGVNLIANGHKHDCSKFYGCEWSYLRADVFNSEQRHLFEYAHHNHVMTNLHHPEHWGSIHSMPRLYVAEMVCDWSARSHEMGNDLREWIREKATKKFDMKVQSKIYKEIKIFVDLLLDPKFK